MTLQNSTLRIPCEDPGNRQGKGSSGDRNCLGTGSRKEIGMTTEAKPELPAHPDRITQATVTGRAHATCERGAECRAEKNPAATLGRCLLLTFPFIEPYEATICLTKSTVSGSRIPPQHTPWWDRL